MNNLGVHMDADAKQNGDITAAHLALLTKLANADTARKATNLLICRMLEEAVPRLLLIRDGAITRIQARRGDSDWEAKEWSPLPFRLERIWRRLTFMSNPPLPWWHRLPLRYQLSFRITERIDHWFWRPTPRQEGRMEITVQNRSFWVSFKCTHSDRIELGYSSIEARPSTEGSRETS